MPRRAQKSRVISDVSEDLLHEYFRSHRRPNMTERRALLKLVHANGDTHYVDPQLRSWFKWQRRKAHMRGSPSPKPDYEQIHRLFNSENAKEKHASDEHSEEDDTALSIPDENANPSHATPHHEAPCKAGKIILQPLTANPEDRETRPPFAENATHASMDIPSGPSPSSSRESSPLSWPSTKTSTPTHINEVELWRSSWLAACTQRSVLTLEEFDALLENVTARAKRYAY